MNRIASALLILVALALPASAVEPTYTGKLYDVTRVSLPRGQAIVEIEFKTTPTPAELELGKRLAQALVKNGNNEPTGKTQIAEGSAPAKKLFIVDTKARGDLFPGFLEIDKVQYLSPKAENGTECFVFTCASDVDRPSTRGHASEVTELLEQLYRPNAVAKLTCKEPARAKSPSRYLAYEN